MSLLDRLKGAVGACDSVREPALSQLCQLTARSSLGLGKPEATPGGDQLPDMAGFNLDTYADQLKRARQMSGLASLLPKGALAAAGGSDSSVAATLKKQEDVIRCASRAHPLRGAD